MQNKKLDKSLLPKPQYPIGWKKGQLKISTSTANQLLDQQMNIDQAPTRKNSHSNQNSHPFSNKNLQQTTTPQSNNQYHQSNNSNRQFHNSLDLQKQLTPSQYSLQQKQLLTFAAQQSKERIMNFNQQGNRQFLIKDSNVRKNNFSRTSNYESSEQKKSNERKSQSKNKEHKVKIYRHYLQQEQQFIAYSVVTKQSRSGMFSNQKLLVLNSSKRQLSYYSNLPKFLPFQSFAQIQSIYLNENRPKQTVQFDRVRRFMFVPGKGNLASVLVSYINELGQRKQWRLGMGNNAIMNEWIETVNQVIKKQHLSVVKSQVKYPPKPKKQSDNKSNNYETKFTKTLKQQVLPLIRQSRLTTSSKSIQNSSLNNSNAKSANNQLSTPKSNQKQYLIDSSKFINTKNYVIDFQDVKNQDIFYVPPPSIINTQEQKTTQKQSTSLINNSSGMQRFPLLTKDEPSNNSTFLQQLQKKQKLINNEHQNRINTFITKQSQQVKQSKSSFIKQNQSKKSQSEIIPQPFGLSKKSSGQRLSQRSQKDLNIHIDSKISFQEYDIKQDVGQSEMMTKKQHQKYFSQAQIDVQEQKDPSISPISLQFPQKNQPESPRKRGYTELVLQSNKYQNRYSQHVKQLNYQMKSQKNNIKPLNKQSGIEEFDKSNNKKSSNKRYQRELTEKSQIEDIIIGGRLNQGYILNFSPYSFNNNWFRLWLETQPNNKVQIYTAFVRACKSIVGRIVDSPQQFSSCYKMTQNNSHIIFSIENITFKIPFKLHLPQGLGEFITLIDFIRSEDFLGQVFKYRKQIEDEYENYQFILNQLSSQFNNGIFSMPIYFPMCCLVKYKGITVLCKPNIESSNLKIHKIPKSDYSIYQSQLQYIEQGCHVGFKLTNEQYLAFDLYQIYLSSFNKSIIYMDNLTKYLPLVKNPLQKSLSSNLQINKTYIEQHIKTGVIMQKKDVNQVQNHLYQNVIRNVSIQIESNQQLFDGSSFVLQRGLKLQHLGLLYKRLDELKKSTKNPQKLNLNIQLLITQIVINEYMKASDIFFMKQFARQLSSSLIDFSHPSTKINQSQFSSSSTSNNIKNIKNLIPQQRSKSLSFSQKFSSTVIQMLNYLLCRNTKVWTVLSNVIDEKYGISEFKTSPNHIPKEQINVLLKKINIQQIVITFLQKLNAQAEVRSWPTNQNWQDFSINEENLFILPKSKLNCFSLNLFNLEYAQLIKQISQKPFTQINHLYSKLFQALSISEETHQGQIYLIKSSDYELLELGYQKERSLIDLNLSSFIPINSKTTNYLNKDKNIDVYKKLLTQSQGRKSHNIDPLNFEVNLNGIKWLIKQKEFTLVELLIQQQLQSLEIWYTPKLLSTKSKLLALAALFYHKKLGNKNNLAIQYSIKSLELALKNKYLLRLPQLAEKSFQSANIHFQCQDLQKSLQLYQLTQQIIFQSQKNKSLQQTDLSIEFLNIYLRKAQIKLTSGKTTQTLYSCLECLKKCQVFEEIVLNNENYDCSMINKLQKIQLNVFQVIFRCYQVTNNIEDMRKISKVCFSKFVEDKILIMRMRHKIHTKSLDDSVHSETMIRLLKMYWITLINQLLQKRLSEKFQSQQQKPLIPLPQSVKSFCLSGAFSQHYKVRLQKTFKILENLKQKLLALCNLYPRNRYNDQTLTLFICQQILQNSSRFTNKKNVSRAQYELIGEVSRKTQLLSSRMEQLIKNSIKQHEYSDSVFYELLSQVIGQLTQNGDKKNQSPSRNSIQRFVASVSFSQQRKSRSKQTKIQKIDRQSHTRTTIKNPLERFYQSSFQKQSSILPFSLQSDQFQPELSISSKFPINYYNNNNFKIENSNNFSLKDQMDKKYMLIQALFGLCGRQFVIGLLDEMIERQKLKYNKNHGNFQCKTSMFYD